MYTESLTDNVVSQSLIGLWQGVVNYVPHIIAAVLIFLVGWLIGWLLGQVVEHVFKALKVDNALKSAGVEDIAERAGIRLNSGKFFGGLVRWFFILAFLLASLDILNLPGATQFLGDVLIELPHVIVAALVLMIGAVVADAVKRLIVASARATEIRSANFIGAIAKWAIWIFAIYTALDQLQIGNDFLLTIIQGLMIALSLAVGLAFGLGGQSAAADYVEKLREEIKSHHEK